MQNPDLQWYTGISKGKKLAPRCPFASVHRCPRYYQSVALLGETGCATKIDPEEDKRLLEQWKRSDLWPVVDEQATSVKGPSDEPKHFMNFCPEVAFDRYGYFSSSLHRYADEIDVDVAHANLAWEGVSIGDWRWQWASVFSMHYSGCPIYSPLLIGVNDVSNRSPIGFRREVDCQPPTG